MTHTPPPPEATAIAVLTVPGHDRDVAEAILSQARLRSSPIDEIQVRHLLAIGWRAGADAGYRRAVQTLRDDEAWMRHWRDNPNVGTWEYGRKKFADYLESLAAAPHPEVADG